MQGTGPLRQGAHHTLLKPGFLAALSPSHDVTQWYLLLLSAAVIKTTLHSSIPKQEGTLCSRGGGVAGHIGALPPRNSSGNHCFEAVTAFVLAQVFFLHAQLGSVGLYRRARSNKHHLSLRNSALFCSVIPSACSPIALVPGRNAGWGQQRDITSKLYGSVAPAAARLGCSLHCCQRHCCCCGSCRAQQSRHLLAGVQSALWCCWVLIAPFGNGLVCARPVAGEYSHCVCCAPHTINASTACCFHSLLFTQQVWR